MLPSRSRKTAGRKAFVSGKALAPYARAFEAIARGQQKLRSFKDAIDRDARHAAMVNRAFAKKTGTAINRLANQGELRCKGPRAFGIGGTEYADNRNPYRGGNVHRSRIIADEQAADREQRRKFSDLARTDEIEGAMTHRAGNTRRHSTFLMRAEKYHIGIEGTNQPVSQFRVALRLPTLRGTVSRARREGNSERIFAHSGGKQPPQRFRPIFLRHRDADFIHQGNPI